MKKYFFFLFFLDISWRKIFKIRRKNILDEWRNRLKLPKDAPVKRRPENKCDSQDCK